MFTLKSILEDLSTDQINKIVAKGVRGGSDDTTSASESSESLSSESMSEESLSTSA